MRSASDRHISHVGMPNGMRAIMTMGDVKGIIDIQNDNVDVGSAAAVMPKIMPNIIGNTTTD